MEQRTIQVFVIITQIAPTPTPIPTPTPAPTPTPSPTPTPAPMINVSVLPSTIVAGAQATVTAQTTNLPTGTNICFDITSNSSPASSLSLTCPNTTTDSTGKALTVLTAGAVTTTQVIIIRGCVDSNSSNSCNSAVELNTNTSATIIPPPTPAPTPTSTPP